MYGTQTVRRGRRNTGQAALSLGAGRGISGRDVRGAGELDLIVRELARSLGAQTGLLAVSDATAGIAEVLATWGAVAGPGGQPLSLAEGFVSRALGFERAAVEPLHAADASLGTAASGARLTHAVGIAVRPAGGPAGALCAGFSSAPPRGRAATLSLLESSERLASLCLADPGALEGVLAGARVDGLTGCLNYAALRSELERELHRCERHRLGLSCCFIDLDNFKQVNDRHGHLRANQTLAAVAAALAAGLRSEDTLGRYGGDEFVALLPGTAAVAAAAMAQRLRETIQATSTPGEHPVLDASIGVAEWHPGSSSEVLLEAADRALRAAKAAGGATVSTAGDPRQPATRRLTAASPP